MASPNPFLAHAFINNPFAINSYNSAAPTPVINPFPSISTTATTATTFAIDTNSGYKWRGKPLLYNSGYVNLETGRPVKEGKAGFIYKNFSKNGSQTLYVTGKSDIMDSFLVENGLKAATKETDKLTLQFAASCSVTGKERVDNFQKAPSVNDVSDEVLASLSIFHISGLEGLGRITRILDGDTVEMLLHVPLASLCKKVESSRVNPSLAASSKLQEGVLRTTDSLLLKRPDQAAGEATGSGYNKIYKAAAYTKDTEAGFFTLFSCRLSGIDFAEHDTVQGILGKKLMTDLYARSDNRVYYRSSTFDKFGRLLVTLYSDPYFRDCINTAFDGYSHPEYGKFLESYGGATKSDYMKNLVKLPLDLQKQWSTYFTGIEPIYPPKRMFFTEEKPKMTAKEVERLDMERK